MPAEASVRHPLSAGLMATISVPGLEAIRQQRGSPAPGAHPSSSVLPPISRCARREVSRTSTRTPASSTSHESTTRIGVAARLLAR
jgi:hypothetical protein